MSIGRKFILYVVFALQLSMVASVSVYSFMEHNEEKNKLEILSRTTGEFIRESLVSLMLERHRSKIDRKLTDIKKTSEVIENIWLLDVEGIVKNSTDRTTLGSRKNISVETGNGEKSWSGSFLKEKKTYELVHSIRNDTPCMRCHGHHAKYNGTLVIDFSVHEITDHIREEVHATGAVMLVVLVIIGSVILVLWKLLVAKRLNAVVDKVRLFKAGIYDSGRDIHSRDEFARLEQDFDRMAEAIRARDEEKRKLVETLSVTNRDLQNQIGLRKQWEVKLHEQKLLSDNLLQNSAVATFVLDIDHRILMWNQACEQLTGLPASSMVGTDRQWTPFYRNRRQTLADIVLDGGTANLGLLYEKYSRSALNEKGLHAEGWYPDLNGSDRYIIFDAAPICDSSGELTAVIETLQDVTEQKRAEAALKSSEAKLRTIIETEPECVKLMGADGRILEINKAGMEMLEADRPDQVVGASIVSFVAPEHKPAVKGHNDRVCRGASEKLEFEVIGLKGTRRWLDTRSTALLDGKGNIEAILAVTRDITDRKQWEHTLQQQLHFLQVLMDTIPLPVFYKDADGKYQGCNKAFEGYLGMQKEKLIGKCVYDVAPKELADEYFQRDEDLYNNPGVQFYESSVKHADGTNHEVIFNKATYTDASGKVAGLLGVMQDITERKRMEEELEQTNETLNALVQASPLAVASFDAEGRVGVWNPAAERIFGWSEEEVLGRFNPLVNEKQKNEFMKLLDRVLRGESLFSVEVVRHRKDGSTIPVSVSSAPLRNSKNETSGIISVIEDITERKRAEDIIRRHYDTQSAINWILHVSLENLPLEKVLKQALDIILSIPWLSFESRGAIFLSEEGSNKLFMKADRGLSDSLKKECRIVPFGKCLCGRAASRSEVQFADCLDSRHEIRYSGMTSHGHYCVPIRHGRSVLGVLNIYLKEGHVQDDREIEFLNAIGNALAGIIRRSRAETALQESEKRYRTLAEAARDVIFIVDRDGRIVYVNSYGAELFHRTTQDLRGKTLPELFSHDTSPRLLANVSRVFSDGESIYLENAFSFADRETWLGTWLVPLINEEGGVDSILGVARDITARKHSEQEREKLISDLQTALNAISRSHKEWQDTFDSITDMIAILDKEHTIVKANKAFAGYFGHHPRDIIRRKCYEFYHQTDAPPRDCPHTRTLAERQDFSQEIFDNATNKIFRITTFPYLSPEGEIIGSIHVSRDVTEEKDRETRLIMSERLAALGQMASGIAHEINNPLASIAGCSEGLLSRIKKGRCDYKLFETYLNIIQEEIFRCKSITTSMLSFVRKTTYEKKKVNLGEMLDKTVEIISFQGRLKGVVVKRTYREIPEIEANEGELRQVFLAVMTNALDAMEEKGTLSLETDAAESKALVRICDTGPGIDPESLGRIFDPFYTTKAERGGTGLGLSIARKIVHNHNGTIEVTSEPGQGTIFTVLLPQ